MTTSEALKPCPFGCGTDELLTAGDPGDEENGALAFVLCTGCAARGPAFELPTKGDAEAAAIAAWNRRVGPTAPETIEADRSAIRSAVLEEGREAGWNEALARAARQFSPTGVYPDGAEVIRRIEMLTFGKKWFRCPEHGDGVSVDEDGCCTGCGCDTTVHSEPATTPPPPEKEPGPLPGHCGLCGGMVSNGGVSCTKGCPGDDGRGYAVPTTTPGMTKERP